MSSRYPFLWNTTDMAHSLYRAFWVAPSLQLSRILASFSKGFLVITVQGCGCTWHGNNCCLPSLGEHHKTPSLLHVSLLQLAVRSDDPRVSMRCRIMSCGHRVA